MKISTMQAKTFFLGILVVAFFCSFIHSAQAASLSSMSVSAETATVTKVPLAEVPALQENNRAEQPAMNADHTNSEQSTDADMRQSGTLPIEDTGREEFVTSNGQNQSMNAEENLLVAENDSRSRWGMPPASTQGATITPVRVSTTNATESRLKDMPLRNATTLNPMANGTMFPSVNGTMIEDRPLTDMPQMKPITGW